MLRVITVILAAASIIVSGAFLAVEVVKNAQPMPPNVVLITVDTLRADHVGAVSGRRGLTPEIDALAGQGAVFTNARSVAFGTTPSHASIMTSLYARQHGIYINDTPLSPDAVTLAEIMKQNGYVTAAFVSALPVDKDRNFQQGFDMFNQWFDPAMDKNERRAEQTTDAALYWLERRPSGPLFMWLHYFDPHQKYDPPGKYKKMFLPTEALDRFNTIPSFRADATAVGQKALYAGEIAYTDMQIGRLIKWFRNRKQFNNTVFIILADHGETLDETRHGKKYDHTTIYDEVARVPLVIRAPGRFVRGARIEAPVCTLDILPTVLQLAEIKNAENVKPEGISLVRMLKGKVVKKDYDRPVFIEAAYRKGAGVVLKNMKYLRFNMLEKRTPDDIPWYRTEMLFNLLMDSGEKDDLTEFGLPEQKELNKLLESWKKKTKRTVPTIKLDDVKRKEMRDKLKQLGYM